MYQYERLLKEAIVEYEKELQKKERTDVESLSFMQLEELYSKLAEERDDEIYCGLY